MKCFMTLCAVVTLSGCVTQSLATYQPVVDPYSTDMNAFQADLVQCRGIASAVKTQYEKQASAQAASSLLIGAATGALVGAAVGAGSANQGDLIAYGAATGASASAASSNEYAAQVRFGPNRIVDRCMANRGYALLNDIGMGTN